VSRAVLAVTVLLAACTTAPHFEVTRLERNLAAQPSATAVLGAVCQRQTGEGTAAIRAELIPDMPSLVPQGLTRQLGSGPGEPVILRHVRLMCGKTVLSVAYNWYLPARLPVDAAKLLETTDTPFGRALAPYHFTRKRLWSQRGRAAECPAGTVLSQSALLQLPGTGPVSLVIECYSAASL
jgi:chorismate-pyruvate lyase